MPSFKFGNTTIDYTLHYQDNKKDVSIVVEWLEGVQVTAPPEIQTEQLHQILYRKAPWMIKKWYELNEIATPPAPKELVSGEKFPYLGRHYRLKVHKEEGRTQDQLELELEFKQGKFHAYIPAECTGNNQSQQQRLVKSQQLRTLFKNWYIHHGQRKVIERVQLYCAKLNVCPSKVTVKEQRMRWGSCTKAGAIYLNWKVFMAPVSVVDYVLVHELAHLKYPDHSKHFWNTVHSILPDYETRKEWLRIHGPTLTL